MDRYGNFCSHTKWCIYGVCPPLYLQPNSLNSVLILMPFCRLYGITAWNGNRKIDLIRQHDANMAILQSQLEDPSLIPTEEHTRRQLLKLLLSDQQQSPHSQQTERIPEEGYYSNEAEIERERVQEEGGVGLPPGLRRDREWRRSGVVMSATVGHGGERVGGSGWWSPV